MQQLFHSPFLQSLGYAIANSLWQTALIWLIYMAVTSIGSISAAAKYRVAVIAQLVGFAWFLITLQFYYHQYSDAWKLAQQSPQPIQTIASTGTGFSSYIINWMVKGEQLLPYVSAAYLMLMLFLCARWMFGYRQTQTLRNNGLQKMPADWRLFVTRIAGQLGIKKEIRIYLSDTVITPLTIGFLKPVILIPVASINHLTTQQLEAVLLHELAHIKRYDYIVNIFLSVVEISLFFNPFTQLLSKSIRKERENACDDWVLQFQYDASVYAEALLRIAYLQAAPAFAMAATGKKNELLTRVKRMIGEKENRFNYRKQLLAFAIVTALLSSVAWLNPITAHTEKSADAALNKRLQMLPSYTIEPMAVQVDNPLFNPVFFLSKPLKEEMKKNIASAQKEIAESMNAVDLQKITTTAVTSITPVVADALEQASLALNSLDNEKILSKTEMNAAKSALNKALHKDSAVFNFNRKTWNDDLSASFKKMETDMSRITTEMENLSMKVDPFIEGISLQQDLLKSMTALSALKRGKEIDKMVAETIDKTINRALPRLQNLTFKRDNKTGKTRINPDDTQEPGNITDIERRQKETESPTGTKTPNQKEKEKDALILLSGLSDLVSASEFSDGKIDLSSLLSLRDIVRKAVEKNQKPKIVQLVNKENKEEDKAITKVQ